MLTNDEVAVLLTNIAELGGKSFREEDILYEGNKLVLPEQFRGQLQKAMDWLKAKIKEEEDEASFSRTFNYRPYDGAVCAFNALKKAFGMVAGQATYSWLFGKQPPMYITVPTSTTTSEEVPWGNFIVPAIDQMTFTFGDTNVKEYGHCFYMAAVGPRKHRFVVQGLFELVDRELREHSIYRGKAIDGQMNFISTEVDTTKVVYSTQVRSDLLTHIWAPMRYRAEHRRLGLPMKRAVLLCGDYGTGKSLAGALTAKEAVANGWTFIIARPGRDSFLDTMHTARLYQPAVVFFEDAEIVTGANDRDVITEVLDVFDGVQAKGTEMMVVLTTNHPEQIHQGMHRPGRVDAQIEIGALDGPGIQELITVTIPRENLSRMIDWDKVVEACEGYVPAFVKEAADRAIRYALARTGSLEGLIDTEDLIYAANGLRAQYTRMKGSPETITAEKPFAQVITEQAHAGARIAISELASEKPSSSVWNPTTLQEARDKPNHR